MKQNEFFNILMDGLKDFPEIKLHDIIFYYENKFTLGLASGKTEEEIINELGSPNLIVNKYRNDDSDTNINSEQLINDYVTTSVINQNPSNYSDSDDSTNSNTGDKTFIKNQNTVTDNKYNDNFNNNSDDKENNLKIDNDLNDFKASSNSNNSNDFDNSNFNNDQNSDTFSNNFTTDNSNDRASQYNINTILRFCIAGLALIVFFPVITGIIGCILGLFGVAISILVGSIGLLVGGTFTSFIGLPNVPMFVANFPYPVIVLFSLGSISLSILLTLLFYYFCKFFIQILIKAYKSLTSKGGAF